MPRPAPNIPGHDYRGHGAHCKGRCGYVQPGAEARPADPYADPEYFDPCQAAGVHVDSCICPPAYERTAPK